MPVSIPAMIQQAAPAYGVPASLALSVANHESGFNQGAIGSSGEIGVFQLMPATAAGLKVDPTDLTQNIQGGLSLLQSLYKQFGNWTQALQAYNAGPTAVVSGNVPASSQSYASSILSASGMDSSSDFASASPTSDLFASVDTLGAGDSSGLSTGAWIALAAVLTVGLLLALRD